MREIAPSAPHACIMHPVGIKFGQKRTLPKRAGRVMVLLRCLGFKEDKQGCAFPYRQSERHTCDENKAARQEFVA